MFGTVKEISAELFREYGADEPLAVLVWDGEAVRYFAQEYHPTAADELAALESIAPASAETDRAITRLSELEQGWMARLPKGWEQDFTVLIDWPMPTLVDLLAFCVSGGIDGLCEKTDRNGRAGAQLDGLEAALGFTLRDWWEPTAQNCFARLSKDQIGDALVDADRLAQAASALKMKKADAAMLAEGEISQTRWVPPCLTPHVPVTTTQPASDDSEAA